MIDWLVLQWQSLVRMVRRGTRLGSKGPWVTASSHAVVTVLGLQPYPCGLVGIAFFAGGWGPWLWLASSLWTACWYVRREVLQQGWSWSEFRQFGFIMFLKPRLTGDGLRRSWAQRWDPVLDVAFPWAAHIGQWVVLVVVL